MEGRLGRRHNLPKDSDYSVLMWIKVIEILLQISGFVKGKR